MFGKTLEDISCRKGKPIFIFGSFNACTVNIWMNWSWCLGWSLCFRRGMHQSLCMGYQHQGQMLSPFLGTFNWGDHWVTYREVDEFRHCLLWRRKWFILIGNLYTFFLYVCEFAFPDESILANTLEAIEDIWNIGMGWCRYYIGLGDPLYHEDVR